MCDLGRGFKEAELYFELDVVGKQGRFTTGCFNKLYQGRRKMRQASAAIEKKQW